MQCKGIIIGLISFFSIGLFHPLVVKGEYYFSKNIWPVFGVFGTVMLVVSLKLKNIIASAGSAVIGMASFWSIKELHEQEQRVAKGWFPKNPKRMNQKR